MTARGIASLLLDPKYCGAPAPEGYACALLYYEDEKARAPGVPSSQVHKPFLREVIGAAAPARPRDPASITLLSPDGCIEGRNAETVRTIVAGAADRSSQSHHSVLRRIIGYGQNASLPIGDARRIDPAQFKRIPAGIGCPKPQKN